MEMWRQELAKGVKLATLGSNHSKIINPPLPKCDMHTSLNHRQCACADHEFVAKGDYKHNVCYIEMTNMTKKSRFGGPHECVY